MGWARGMAGSEQEASWGLLCAGQSWELTSQPGWIPESAE